MGSIGDTWNFKQQTDMEKSLIDDVLNYATRSVGNLVSQGLDKLGSKASSLLDTFGDDVHAAASAIRSWPNHQNSGTSKEKMITIVGPQWSWSSLIDTYSPEMSKTFESSEQFAEKGLIGAAIGCGTSLLGGGGLWGCAQSGLGGLLMG